MLVTGPLQMEALIYHASPIPGAFTYLRKIEPTPTSTFPRDCFPSLKASGN